MKKLNLKNQRTKRFRRFLDTLLLLIIIGITMIFFINPLLSLIFPSPFGVGTLNSSIIFTVLLFLLVFILSIIFYFIILIGMYKTKKYVWFIISIILGLYILLTDLQFIIFINFVNIFFYLIYYRKFLLKRLK